MSAVLATDPSAASPATIESENRLRSLDRVCVAEVHLARGVSSNVHAGMPGMDAMATRMMQKKIDENGTATIEELIDVSLESGVDLQACQMILVRMEETHPEFGSHDPSDAP